MSINPPAVAPSSTQLNQPFLEVSRNSTEESSSCWLFCCFRGAEPDDSDLKRVKSAAQSRLKGNLSQDKATPAAPSSSTPAPEKRPAFSDLSRSSSLLADAQRTIGTPSTPSQLPQLASPPRAKSHASYGSFIESSRPSQEAQPPSSPSIDLAPEHSPLRLAESNALQESDLDSSRVSIRSASPSINLAPEHSPLRLNDSFHSPDSNPQSSQPNSESSPSSIIAHHFHSPSSANASPNSPLQGTKPHPKIRPIDQVTRRLSYQADSKPNSPR